MAIQHFRELKVYQIAFDAAMRIFELSKEWPGEERYSLTDQIRRSSRSTCASIAEAWRKRRYSAHFISKLSDADSEVAETQSWLDFALACGYLDETDRIDLNACYEQVTGGLVRMTAEPEKWCFQADRVREESAAYDVKGWDE